jgi:hypothetical protein
MATGTTKNWARAGLALVTGAAACAVAFGGVALGAPAAGAATTGIATASALTGGTATIGKHISASGITGVATGTLTPGAGGTFDVVLPKAEVQILPGTATMSLGFLKLGLPTTFMADSAITGTASLGAGGSIDATLASSLSTTARVGPFACTIGPITAALTTGTSGSLTGAPFTGSLTGVESGVLVANDFAVPAVQATPACPGLVAGLVNVLAGLPLAPGASSLTFHATLVNGLTGAPHQLTSVPTRGAAGTQVAVIGTGWAPSTVANLAFTSGRPASTGAASVDAAGALGGFVSVTRSDAAGSNPIVATQGTATGSTPFTVVGTQSGGFFWPFGW